MLDIRLFSSIIYIWYEGGELRPHLVRLTGAKKLDLAPPHQNRLSLALTFTQPDHRRAEGTQTREATASGEHARRQSLDRVPRVVSQYTHMKGGITDNGEESQGREEEGRQETLS